LRQAEIAKEPDMLFAEVIELVLVAAIILFLVTQIVIPLLRGIPFLPLLRKERKLSEELAEAEEDVQNLEMEQRIGAARQRAGDLRQRQRSGDLEPGKEQEQATRSTVEGDGRRQQ
jgi:hypothetical protein